MGYKFNPFTGTLDEVVVGTDYGTDIATISADVIINTDDIDVLSAQVAVIEASDDWVREGTTITQKHLGDDLLLSGGDLKVSDLTSPAGTIVVTDEEGKLGHTSVAITEILNGSIINLGEFATQPDTVDLIAGDTFIVDSPSTSGKLLSFFDGVDLYGIELGKV